MTIRTHDDKTYPVRGCGVFGNDLHIRLPAGMGFREAAAVFDAIESTEELVYESEAECVTYSGYTRLTYIGTSQWEPDTICVTLRKEAAL